MLANLVCSLIEHKRVTTTLAKAKAARSVAEKMVTLGKSGTVHDRRLAVARLHQEAAARILFKEIAPAFKDATAAIRDRQDEPAQRRCRAARHFGMGGFCGRSASGSGNRASPEETKPEEKK